MTMGDLFAREREARLRMRAVSDQLEALWSRVSIDEELETPSFATSFRAEELVRSALGNLDDVPGYWSAGGRREIRSMFWDVGLRPPVIDQALDVIEASLEFVPDREPSLEDDLARLRARTDG
jgi:hypothetical protein